MQRRKFLQLGLLSVLSAFSMGMVKDKVRQWLPNVFTIHRKDYDFFIVRTFKVLSHTRKYNNTHTRLYTTVYRADGSWYSTWDINSHCGEMSCWKRLWLNIKELENPDSNHWVRQTGYTKKP